MERVCEVVWAFYAYEVDLNSFKRVVLTPQAAFAVVVVLFVNMVKMQWAAGDAAGPSSPKAHVLPPLSYTQPIDATDAAYILRGLWAAVQRLLFHHFLTCTRSL
jgi:hypothetical protein